MVYELFKASLPNYGTDHPLGNEVKVKVNLQWKLNSYMETYLIY